MPTLREKLKEEMTLFGFAESTKTVYLNALIKLKNYYNKSPAKLTYEEVRQYLVHLKAKKNCQITLITSKFTP